MSVANTKKAQALHTYEWAGVVARARRGGGSLRSGRRAALLGILSSTYANSVRGTSRTADGRSNGGDRA